MTTIEIILAIIILIIVFIVGYNLGKLIGTLKKQREYDKNLPHLRKQAITQSRSVLQGQISEQLSPYLPNFPAHPGDVQFMGKPIDFIAFNKRDNIIQSISFIEVKTGKSQLNKHQQEVKEAIKKKKVDFKEYRIDQFNK